MVFVLLVFPQPCPAGLQLIYIFVPSHQYSYMALIYALFTALSQTVSGRLICSVIWVSASSITERHRFRACSSVSNPSGTTSIR